MVELKKFTVKELEEYAGKDGKLGYVAYQGKVYDISRRAVSGPEVNIWACTTRERTSQKSWSLHLTEKKSWKE